MKKLIKSPKDAENSKHFCILPWVHAHILPDSTVLPCCVSDFGMPYGKTNETSLKNIWNNEDFKDMRKRMLEDQPVASCHNCYELEASNMKSMRKRMNSMFKHRIALTEKTKKDGEYSDIKMRYLDIRFSNLCNFKCRGCSPFCSSQWFDDYRELWGVNVNDEKLVSLNMLNLQKEELIEYLESLEIAYFAGGEPLMMDEHYYCLEKLIELKKDIPIHYNSNLSVLKFKKYDLIDLWRKFSHIDLNISIDDIGARGEYFRHGFNWEKFQENVLKIKEELPTVWFQVTCTISLFNIHRIPEIHQAMMNMGIINEFGFTLNPLQDPAYYRTQVLPGAEKKKVTKKLQSYKKQLDVLYPGKNWSTFRGSIDGIISVMNNIDQSSQRDQFSQITSKLDQLRDESFASTFPELSFMLPSKIMLFVPLKNQEARIQPLMRKLEKNLLPMCELVMFVDENSEDQTEHVLSLELPNLKDKYKYIKLNKNESRGHSFKIAAGYAREKRFDFLLTVDEGWEDSIDEFEKLLLDRVYLHSDMIVGTRTPQRKNLGGYIDRLSNFLTSLITRTKIAETKGDAIHLISVKKLDRTFVSIPNSSDYFYKIMLDFCRFGAKVEFTKLNMGINYSSQVKLNLGRLLYILKELVVFTARKGTSQLQKSDNQQVGQG